jgi:hypothetical protein
VLPISAIAQAIERLHRISEDSTEYCTPEPIPESLKRRHCAARGPARWRTGRWYPEIALFPFFRHAQAPACVTSPSPAMNDSSPPDRQYPTLNIVFRPGYALPDTLRSPSHNRDLPQEQQEIFLVVYDLPSRRCSQDSADGRDLGYERECRLGSSL